MIPGVEFRRAEPGDEAAIRRFVASAGLPSSDISLARQEFVLALAGEELTGCVGLEAYGDAALLRSLAVVDGRRNQGLGTALSRRILARAAMHGISTAYALTTTAERFCLREGFERVDRSMVPAELAGSAQFRGLCPMTAACFRRRIDGDPPVATAELPA